MDNVEMCIEEFKGIIDFLPLSVSRINNKLIIEIDEAKISQVEGVKNSEWEKIISEKKWEVDVRDIVDIIQNLNEKEKKKEIEIETVLYDEYSYEVLVTFRDSRLPMLSKTGRDSYIVEDPKNGIEYELSKASDEYSIFILKNLESRFVKRFVIGFLHRIIEEETPNFFDAIKDVVRNLYTIKVGSKNPREFIFFNEVKSSLLFYLNYEWHKPINEVVYFEVVLDHITKMTRLQVLRIELRVEGGPEEKPLEKLYKPDLVNHYQSALSTDHLPSEFLSFYHVAEHFFEGSKIDYLDSFNEMIKNSQFTPDEQEDLEYFVKLVKNKVRFEEEDLLELVLERYVKELGNIKKRLGAELIDYYQNNEVPFSPKSSKVNFDDKDTVYENLASRIYQTRNSIVHSKEGRGDRYIPFKHDNDLRKEIPLIRVIAEQIIIESAEEIK